MKVVAGPDADCEVDAIRRVLAEDNPSVAESFVEAFRRTMKWIGDFPKATQVSFTSVRGNEVRIRPIPEFPKLLVVYVIQSNAVTIAHVVHGSRDWKRSLSQAYRPRREDA